MNVFQMDQLIKKLVSLCNRCSELEVQHGTEANNFFARAGNSATLVYELLNYFRTIWGGDANSTQQIERCISAQRQLFIEVMSQLEYCVRDVVRRKKTPDLIDHVDRREKLWARLEDIFNKDTDPCVQQLCSDVKKAVKDVPPFDSFGKLREVSEAKSLLDKEHAQVLKFAISARNSFVHNNSIGHQDDSIQLSDCNLKLRKNEQMTSEPIHGLVVLTYQIIEVADKWFCAILNHANG